MTIHHRGLFAAVVTLCSFACAPELAPVPQLEQAAPPAPAGREFVPPPAPASAPSSDMDPTAVPRERPSTSSPTPGRTLAHLVFTVPGAFTDELRVVREDGEGLRTVAQATRPDKLAFCAVTATGQIVFERHTSTGARLWVVNADGSGTLALANSGTDEHFKALVDGVVFFERSEDGQADLYSVKLDGTALTEIATSALPETFVGVTNGFVTWLRHEGARADFFRAPVNGGSVVRLTETPHAKTTFVVSPGGVVVFQDSPPEPGSSATLLSLNVTTGALRWLSDLNENATPRALFGEQLLYTSGLGSTLVRLDGSERVSFDRASVIRGELSSGSVLVSAPGVAGSVDLFVADRAGALVRALGATALDEQLVSTLGEDRVLLSRGRELLAIGADGSGELVLGHGDFLSVLADGRVLSLQRGEGDCTDDLRALATDGSQSRALASALCSARLTASTPSGGLIVTHRIGASDDLLLVQPDGLPRVLANSTGDERFNGMF